MPPTLSLSENGGEVRPRGQGSRPRAATIHVSHPYDLRRTLECGQVFRWAHRDGDAVGTFRGVRWNVRQEGERLYARHDGAGVRGQLSALWHYLAIDAPLGGIEGALARDPALRRILPHTTGIAIMRQDPWECLISFVISAFNNIPKIRLSVERLSRRFGDAFAGDGYAFPTAARLADARLPALRACILGYRAPYVRGVARAVADRTVELSRLARLSHDQAREALLALPGVGEKVADCVLLFSLGHTGAFPVDVWVQRGVQEAYFRGRRLSARAIGPWARDRFGPLAGYANQHLFLAARSGLI